MEQLVQRRENLGDVDWHVRVDVERALAVRDRCLLLLLVFKRVV